MDFNVLLLVISVGALIVFAVVNGRSKGGRNICTRCSGTGEVNEKWPDPDAPGGWHKLDGICPKCKGKGRV
jgi:DnaJ-class molecular chaperone